MHLDYLCSVDSKLAIIDFSATTDRTTPPFTFRYNDSKIHVKIRVRKEDKKKRIATKFFSHRIVLACISLFIYLTFSSPFVFVGVLLVLHRSIIINNVFFSHTYEIIHKWKGVAYIIRVLHTICLCLGLNKRQVSSTFSSIVRVSHLYTHISKIDIFFELQWPIYLPEPMHNRWDDPM